MSKWSDEHYDRLSADFNQTGVLRQNPESKRTISAMDKKFGPNPYPNSRGSGAMTGRRNGNYDED